MFRAIIIAACLMAAATAEAANRVVVRRGLRRDVVVQRPVRQQIVVPRSSAVIAPHSLVVPQAIVVPHHVAQPLVIFR